MARASWRGVTVAETDDPLVVEGNVYFPAADVSAECLRPSPRTSVCGWKGTARYWHVVVGEATAEDAAWSYPEPKEAARALAGRIAFWRGVVVER